MMSYIDHVKNKTMRNDPDQYFDDVKVHLFFINNKKFKQSPRKSLTC